VQPSSHLDSTFAALAHPTRRAILAHLAAGERTVGELAEPFAMSLPAVSRHLKVLERASLIVKLPDRQSRRCRLNAAALGEASAWLAFYRQFWDDSFDRLAEHIRQSPKAKEAAHGKARAARRR
jgi:DNA-binding transcriptional ArsR family regulator